MKLLITLFACCALAPAQVAAPSAGSARFAGQVFAVHGIPANLLVAKTPWISATAVSFSSAGGLILQDGNILLLGPGGPLIAAADASGESEAVLNIDASLTSAIAWLPNRHTLLYWNGVAFVSRPVNDSAFGGEVICLQARSPRTAKLLVTHADARVSAVTVSLETGEPISIDLLPSVRGHAFIQGSSVLYQQENGLVVESPSGGRRIITLAHTFLPADDLTAERMSADWLHISSASTGQHWALYLNHDDLLLSALPSPPPAVAARQTEVAR